MELSSVLERNHGGLFTTNLPHETDISESGTRLENRNLHSLPVTTEQVEEVKTHQGTHLASLREFSETLWRLRCSLNPADGPGQEQPGGLPEPSRKHLGANNSAATAAAAWISGSVARRRY